MIMETVLVKTELATMIPMMKQVLVMSMASIPNRSVLRERKVLRSVFPLNMSAKKYRKIEVMV